MIAVEYHDDLKEVQSDPRLSSLLSAAEQQVPFDRLDWWRLLVRECGELPLIAVAREGEGRAVLPLRRKQRRIEALANWYSFRVRPVISSQGDPVRLLGALARDLAGEAPRIVLAPLPDEERETTQLAEAFRAAGWFVHRERCDSNHALHVCGRTFEQYLVGRPGQLRTTLKRKSKKVETEVLTRFDAGIWEDYEAIYRESWKPDEGSPTFLRAFAEAEGEAGRLRLGIACSQGQPVAAQMWTVEGGVAYIHKLAHREEAKAVSPGSVLSAALFRHVIDVDKVSLVDFGTGDDPYKRDWMEEVRPRYRLDMMRPGWPGNWPAIAKHLLRRLARRGKRG